MPLPTLNPKVATFSPIGKNLLVRRIAAEEKIGEIFMPENRTRVGLARADVLAVGPKVEHVKAGDVIHFPGQFTPNRIDYAGETCEVFPEANVFAVETP